MRFSVGRGKPPCACERLHVGLKESCVEWQRRKIILPGVKWLRKRTTSETPIQNKKILLPNLNKKEA